MKISKIGEFGLIEKISKILNNRVHGSDCAPVNLERGTYLTSCDILLEGQHFLRHYPARKIGFKSISVNVSDIVASGGRPEYILVSLLLPNLEVSYVKMLYEGIKTACKKYKCQVIGGNITKSEKIGIDVFIIGKTTKFIPRKNSAVGDSIFVTGNLGDSKAGMELLQMKKHRLEPFEKVLIERYLKPVIDVNVSDYMSVHATSSMDISDGLSSDVNHLFKGDKVRIQLYSADIPTSKELKLYCKKYGHDPIQYALSGGEDYKVMFTQKEAKSKFIRIGQVEKGTGIFIDDVKILNHGFNHFK